MGFSWHEDHYRKALRSMARKAGELCGDVSRCEGWLLWFSKEHPDKHARHAEAIEKINSLWGQSSSKAMEEFKKAVKVEVDATLWALEEYLKTRPTEPGDEEPLGPLTGITIQVTETRRLADVVQ